MSEQLQDLSLTQIAWRVLFACAVTLAAAAGAYLTLRWLFGV